ncbi:vWA domain-containing protein [Acidicapsa ligni]|uniref:hypothetical protein n=1 Tax=Acidicapsa ligni TaxID=542300 RepID=UPI0021DFF15E|nr:hypothetical protein [Acidicapsa ligni]
MSKLRVAVGMMAGALLLAAPAFGQYEQKGQGQAVITILPKQDGAPASVSTQGLKLQVGGKEADITSFKPLGPQAGLEMVVLIDGGARNGLGSQMEEIAHFIQRLPPNAKVGIAYMQNGRSVFASPLSTDRALVLKGLHLPGGVPGLNASPYFCISDLAKSWPSNDRTARREVIAITDGVDNYERRFDPDDPYLQAAITDSVRAGLIIYTIYWRDQGRANNTLYQNNAGQNLMLQVTQSTGGRSYWEGIGNPVSFQPYLEDLNRRLLNQYELSFVTNLSGKPQVTNMRLKLKVPGSSVDIPGQVFVYRQGAAQE